MSASTKGYESIFAHRGEFYHQAMDLCPSARRQEFIGALDLIEIRSGMCVLDIPSGGGYLKQYIHEREPTAKVIELDPSQGFLASSNQIQNCQWDCFPLPDNSVDCIVSIAGLHHLLNRNQFYDECYRVLRPNGQLIIAEVGVGSKEAEFLNVAVNQANPQGHEGYFLEPQVEQGLLHRAGFKDISVKRKKCSWQFTGEQTMLEFCRLLFGMALVDKQEVRSLLERYLNVVEVEGGLVLSWGLDFYVGENLSS